MPKEIIQQFFNFPHPVRMDKNNFIISSCNVTAFNIIQKWPEWQDFALCLYGPKGCGKTYLANIFAQNVQEKTDGSLIASFMNASQIDMFSAEALFSQTKVLVIENFNESVPNESMFHLYNYYKDHGGYLLILAEKSLSHMKFKIADLASRMHAVNAVEILQPDDTMLSQLLEKLFEDRKIKNISPDVIKYAVSNMTRSYEYAENLVKEIDDISLSNKRPISIFIVKQAIENLNNFFQSDFFT